MALGKEDKQKKTYLSISDGRVVVGSGNAKQYYDYVDGMLQGISQKESTFANGVVNRWYIDLTDGDDAYCLCLPYSSGTFKSIILSLASDPELTSRTPIRIEPYLGKNNFTKVVVYSNGVKLDWVTRTLPPEEKIIVGGKEVKDDAKRMQFIEQQVDVVLKRIGAKVLSSCNF